MFHFERTVRYWSLKFHRMNLEDEGIRRRPSEVENQYLKTLDEEKPTSKFHRNTPDNIIDNINVII